MNGQNSSDKQSVEDNKQDKNSNVVKIDVTKSKKQKQTPIEQDWIQYLRRTFDYAISYSDNGLAILNRWNKEKRIWEIVNDDQHSGDVTTFILKYYPEKFKANAVTNCLKVTKSFLISSGREIKLSKDFIISTKSHFLKVSKDGIRSIDKDDLAGACKKYFVRCHVDIDLYKTAKDRIANYYKTQSNSQIENKYTLFAKMIKLGFPKIDNRRCAQEFLGDTLNPEKRKAFPVLVGEPDGGKSQFLSLLMGIHNNSAQIDLERLDTFDSQKLLGKSLICVDEIGKRISEKHFKRMIGGSRFDIQRKGIENLSIKTDFKIIAADNEVFGFSEKTGAMETRIFLIKVETVKKEDRVDDIAEKIVADEYEKTDLLEWLLNGAMEVLKRGRLMRHEEMPQDSKQKMDKMINKQNPCVEFLTESSVKFNPNNLIPKIDVFKNFLMFCEETNRSVLKKVNFETWCRDYFSSAIKQVCQDYDETYERRAYANIGNERKRVACFPIEFLNLPEYNGKKISQMESAKSYYDENSYEKDKLPKHILDEIMRKAEEIKKIADLTEKQKIMYAEQRLKEEGFKMDENGIWFKGDANIKF